ncbi:RidA family protein [Hymenobacter sp. YC55]|uniref:RidA family protein n=1 Tax=Hymenobacter sp. YC55 TaxID=3034019 RepID=UPI0023F767B0|nr:RidA family protein [Hymenobacter sp. YC55]MDF7811597.1 RidA family protein [Hymenobacter sp. YC55]
MIKLLFSSGLWLLATAAAAQTRPAPVTFLNPATVAPAKGYSHAAQVDLGPSTMLIISGQVALDAQDVVVGPGNMGKQAEQAFANLKAIVEAAGGTMRDVVKLSYFLLDVSQLPAVRTARDRYINTATPPASTAVQVSKLFREDLLIEIEATAIIPKKPGSR